MSKILVDKGVLEQALEALEADNSKLWPSDRRTAAYFNLRAALAEPVQEQDIEDAIEAAYWQFDCRRSGLNEWASAPQSERDAFKAEARKLVRGYFPTRQAQDTKREMLAVANAFIRGKRAALEEYDDEPTYCPTRGEEDGGTTCGMPAYPDPCPGCVPGQMCSHINCGRYALSSKGGVMNAQRKA